MCAGAMSALFHRKRAASPLSQWQVDCVQEFVSSGVSVRYIPCGMMVSHSKSYPFQHCTRTWEMETISLR